jgi:hypothetical protein
MTSVEALLTAMNSPSAEECAMQFYCLASHDTVSKLIMKT